MTIYNVAITVGPNIFRSVNDTAESIMNHSVYYDVFIRMIENYDKLFTIDIEVDYLNKNKIDYTK